MTQRRQALRREVDVVRAESAHQRDRARDPSFGEPDDGACGALDDLAGELDE